MPSFFRDLFTGELKEREQTEGRRVIARTTVSPHLVQGRAKSVWSRPLVMENLAVPIEQMEAENEAAKKHGTGAYYVPGDHGFANCVVDSRQTRAREMARRETYDADGGYGDAQPGDSSRYRSAKKDIVGYLRSAYVPADEWLREEAAAEIERLRAELARTRKELAETEDKLDTWQGWDVETA